jgi:hypothetical protein
MAVKPLDWISWSAARTRMHEIWRPWSDLYREANEAMVRALRSRQVHYRGEAYDLQTFRLVPIENVISTLRDLNVYLGDESSAEYEITGITTTSFGTSLLRVSQPDTWTSTNTARIRNPELVWSEFRDYLIRFELPASVQPDRARSPHGRGAPRSRRKRTKQMRAINRHPQHGPKPGTTGFDTSDRALFPEIEQLRRMGKARSGIAATRILAEAGKIGGSGTPESLAARLARRYGQWRSASAPNG